jgi:hypothetical protein
MADNFLRPVWGLLGGVPKLRYGIVPALVLAGYVGAAAAQESPEYRGTEQQRMACTPDVFRLCWNAIPSVSRIVDCLKRERLQLSPGCRAVFVPNGAPRTARRHHRHHYMALEARYMHRPRARRD